MQTKSKTLIFNHRVTDQEQIDSFLGGQILEKVNHYKDIGFELDSQLYHHLYITKIIKSINNKIWLFAKIRKFFVDLYGDAKHGHKDLQRYDPPLY